MKRFYEIDALRGIAIIAMIVFHTVYILVLLEFIYFDMFSGFWWVFPRCIAATFLLIVGISLTLSYNRAKHSLNRRNIIKKYVLRGLLLIMLGAVITIVSFFVFGYERFVLFGILHLIGVMIIISIPFLAFKFINLITGLLVLGVGLFIGLFRYDFYWLLWLGFRPDNYYPVDYLPILPWSCFIFFGMFIGNFFYKDMKRRIPLPGIGDALLVKGLCFLGRISLYIYLCHIPLIYGIFFGIKILLNR